MTSFKYSISILICSCIFMISCQKFLEVPQPADSIISENVFQDDVKATAAVIGIYANMINGEPAFCNQLTTIYTAMYSDEMQRFNPSTNYSEFMNNELTATNTQVKNIWATAFKQIYYTNAAIEGLTKSNNITEAVKQQLIAECKVIRAFCYFYLVNLYGDVPLITSTNYALNSITARSKVDQIFNFLINELSEAKALLNTSYPGNEKVRVNKWSATALLARVYLFTGQWQKAEVESSEIIGSGIFTPLPALNSVFIKNSKESILQLMPQTGIIPELSQSRPSGGTPRNFLTNHLLNSFQPGDQRRTRWLDSITYQSVKYYYPGKYKNTSSSTIAEYYTLLRASEQYLIRAESRVKLNNIPGAIEDLNIIRSRAGLSDYSGILSTEYVLQAIEQERINELFCEWGHRWLDLKRTGRASTVIGAIKPNWQNLDLLFPIPQDDIMRNPTLTQNPGY